MKICLVVTMQYVAVGYMRKHLIKTNHTENAVETSFIRRMIDSLVSLRNNVVWSYSKENVF